MCCTYFNSRKKQKKQVVFGKFDFIPGFVMLFRINVYHYVYVCFFMYVMNCLSVARLVNMHISFVLLCYETVHRFQNCLTYLRVKFISLPKQSVRLHDLINITFNIKLFKYRS